MDLLEESAANISRKCLALFNKCLTHRTSQPVDGPSQSGKEDAKQLKTAQESPVDEGLEYRLADFNLWIDGIGALASSQASLDTRLSKRPIDLSLVKGNLIMLYQAIEDCADLQEKNVPLDEALLDIDSALENLASLSLAIRRTGKRSRLHKADRLFNQDEHIGLKRHLECIVLLRPGEGGFREDYYEHRLETLTPVQRHLIQANLRRRNRFLQAQRHSQGLKKRNHDLLSVLEAAATDEPRQTREISQDHTSSGLDLVPDAPDVAAKRVVPRNNDAPTISGTSASIPESKLRYNDPGLKKSIAKTEITRITASARYPRPKLPDENQQIFQCPCCCQTLPVQDVKSDGRWRKHLSEDLCPYTCIVQGCPTPDIYYSTRMALERHVRQDHSPTWECPICEDSPLFTTMTDIMDHFYQSHRGAVEEHEISALISSSAQHRMGIDACPLCDVTGLVDSPELVDHVLEHIHDFSLRSLPWPRSSGVDLGGEVGSFDHEHGNTPTIAQWLEPLNREPSDISIHDAHLQLSEFDGNRLALIAEQMRLDEDADLPVDILFADEHGDKSAAAETNISRSTQAVSWESDDTGSEKESANSGDGIGAVHDGGEAEAVERPQTTQIEVPIDGGGTLSPKEGSRFNFLGRMRKIIDSVALMDSLGITAIPPKQTRSTDEPSSWPPHSIPPTFFGTEMTMQNIFDDLRGEAELLSREKFAEFLQTIQGENYIDHLDKDGYTIVDFLFSWVTNHSLNIMGPSPEKDLSKPITNYFINSSSNTYLVGNQLFSSSSPEAYKDVLLKGCRCVDIDVWNGDSVVTTPPSESAEPSHQRWQSLGETVVSRYKEFFSPGKNRSTEEVEADSDVTRSPQSIPRGEPLVTHGWAMAAPCGFREVCVAIGESAFVYNDLPIIISLEVHADLEQQEVMVRIMKEVWGEMLLDEPCVGADPRFRLPTLGDLRNKILVKVKESAPETSPDPNRDPGPKHTSKVAICPALGNLAIYTRSVKFSGFDSQQAKQPSHVFSISDMKLLELRERDGRGLFKHNKSYFMRSLPPPTRIDSPNPYPVLFWSMGVQMVAMCWQYCDDGLMLNHGMFVDEYGWALKPPGYQSWDKISENSHQASPENLLELAITVFCGQNVALEHSDDEYSNRSSQELRPLVKVALFVDHDECRKQRTGSGRTRHPQFGPQGTTLSFGRFPRVIPELTFLQFKVEDEANFVSRPLSWSCIRLDRLRDGYRFVQLFDPKGDPMLGAKLLVKVTKSLRDL